MIWYKILLYRLGWYLFKYDKQITIGLMALVLTLIMLYIKR